MGIQSDYGATPITAARVLAIAGPIALSNATTPLQGAVDTAVIGNLGEVAPLAAVGLGAEIISLAFAGFNFLQIGTSGLGAQALGRRDPQGVLAVLARGLIIAIGLALALILIKVPLRNLGLALFEGGVETEALAGLYVDIRIWGAPAELANMALVGWFAGQEMTRRLFQHQMLLAGLNIALNIVLAAGLGWGVTGVAAGTVIASYLGLAYGLWLVRGRIRELSPSGALPSTDRILKRAAMARLFTLSRNIFIRTFLLVGAFAWMARLGTLVDQAEMAAAGRALTPVGPVGVLTWMQLDSLIGGATLAANVVLFNFFLVSAYGLDGFAIASETLVGQTVGARNRTQLLRAVRITTVCSGLMALGVSLAFWALSGTIIDLFTTSAEVQARAREFAVWAALIPLIGFASFQLDGIFVGATRASEMRNGMIISTGLYLPLSYGLMLAYGNHGVWAAVWIWLLLRAATLMIYFPRVLRQAERATVSGSAANS
ncbi:MAG: MATE family efflux transporter [Neomegalonema sp.]|nr:MATE family efflux transporter [Neomegalonema sp.]